MSGPSEHDIKHAEQQTGNRAIGWNEAGAQAKRVFATGATRDTDHGKPDYEGFLSPPVIEAFGAYMHKNRRQADGSYRDSDNWQKGIPVDQYMKSMWRHFLAVWRAQRCSTGSPETADRHTDDLCALLFNVQGMLHELLKRRPIAQLEQRACKVEPPTWEAVKNQSQAADAFERAKRSAEDEAWKLDREADMRRWYSKYTAGGAAE